ncbi:hypothetical protein SAMN06265338_1438 [Rhodoblastus acidophilus]|uniref:Uncharacterized protein n=1 Tax=Rhodoblastus acidophilus TaxID=1074 RepID=A0A212SHE5_RHOAC|nr:hypothetical protein [Rhodoblastus acidophilus]SNB85049.1 hypothetical protein SAMN06265338_1438 [Rhodoblastus acidophilus]
MTYELNFIGMDGLDHTETHVGDETSKNQLVIFLEERGAHCITVDEVSDE